MEQLQKKHYFLAFIATSFLFSQAGFAEKIYRWVDDEGKTYFTNNKALVPLELNNPDIIKMKDTPPPPPPPLTIADGKILWEANCVQCHLISSQGKPGFRGIALLLKSLNNPSSSFEKSVSVLQGAINDNMDDAIKLDLMPDEVRAVVRYIESQTSQSAPKKTEEAQTKTK